MAKKRDRPYGANVTPVDALDSLIGSTAAAEVIPLQEIQTRPQQPRRYFDPQKQEQLLQSIREHGILEPLLVRPLASDRYELVAGERRYRAAVALKLSEVPVVIRELSNWEALQLTLVENLQREDLNPVEETEGILQLLALHLDRDGAEVRQLLYQMKNALEKEKKSRDNVIPKSNSAAEQQVQSVFASLGQDWYSFTCNLLPLLNLPADILEALRQGQIEYTKAKAISRVKEETARRKLLKEAIAQSLSLSQIRERVRAAQPSQPNEELLTRLDVTYKQVKKAKQMLENPKKRKKLESLLTQLEKLLASEN